jgi:hypothetical protein
MNSGEHGDGLLGHIYSSENVSSLRDTRKSLSEELAGKMVKVQVDMVLVLSNTAALTDFHSHRPRHNITGCQILGRRSISLHKTLTLRVTQNTSLSTATLSDEATGAVNTGGMELHELGVHKGNSGAQGHGRTITYTVAR